MTFFSGIIYAWSILKVPLRDDLGFTAQQLSTTYSITLICFCLGSFLGGKLQTKFQPRYILAGCMLVAPSAFYIVSRLDGSAPVLLYLSYGVMAGTALGMTYNCMIVNTGRWFPDKRGFCNAFLCTGLGLSTIVLGSAMEAIMKMPEIGWRNAYVGIAVILALVYIVNLLICTIPPEGMQFPEPKKKESLHRVDDFETRNYTPQEMMRRFSFWGMFFCNMMIGIVGLTLIGCARELIITWDTPGEIATIIVGIMSLANAGSRIAAGLMADRLPLKYVSLFAGAMPVIGCAFVLTATISGAAVIGSIGMLIIGFGYGFVSTYLGVAIAAFYGSLHYGVNFSVLALIMAPASFLSGVCMKAFDTTGTYLPLLAAMTVIALFALAITRLFRKP